MPKGYIKLHRKMLDWEWYKHPPTVVVWVTLLLMAEWKKGGDLKPGQIFTTRREIVEITGLSDRQVRTALKHLSEATNETTNETTIKTTNHGMLITIEKWRSYQGRGSASDQRSDQQNDQQNDQPTLYKKNKEIYKEGQSDEAGDEGDFVPMPEELKAKLLRFNM